MKTPILLLIALMCAPAVMAQDAPDIKLMPPVENAATGAAIPADTAQIKAHGFYVSDIKLMPPVENAATVIPKDLRIRGDQVVGDPGAAIPADTAQIKALVDSSQKITGFYVSNGKRVAQVTTTYDYLMEGGKHMITTEKIQKVRDLRNFVTAHPHQARVMSFTKRWYDRLQPIALVVAVLVQRLI